MTRKVVSLAGDAPLETAAWILAAEAVSGAPVRDERGNLIGVLSKSDLVDMMREEQDAKLVEDVMTPGVWAVHPDAPAIEAVRVMLDKCIHRVVVVRGPGQLEGIVSSMDVLRALARGQFHPDDMIALHDPSADEGADEGEDAGEGNGVDATRASLRAHRM